MKSFGLHPPTFSYRRFAWLVLLGMLILFLDFVSKAYVYYMIPYFKGFTVFENFLGIDFAIQMAVNKGAAWGLFADFQWILLAVRVLVILAILIYLFFINNFPAVEVPLVLIISGAIGNVVDFFLYGYVIDFLNFNLWGYHFPVFNFADTSITIGVILFFVVSTTTKRKLQT